MHIALVCPELHGHLNPMCTFGRALQARGHRVTLVGSPEAEAKATKVGLAFQAIGRAEHDSGEASADRAKLATLTGFAAMKFTGQLLRTQAAIGLRDLPNAVRAIRADGLVVDQVSPAGGCVSEHLGLPFAVACNALAMNQEPAVPPAPTPWPFRRGPLARLRNRLGNLLLRVAARPITETVNAFRTRHRLPPWSLSSRNTYALVQLAQQPAFFDYPRTELPDHFHYTGPWHTAERDADVPFPWDKLDGRPVVYASLGTLQNRLKRVFAAMLEGCSTLDVQVVLALGSRDATWDGPVPANAIVVPFAPQLPLLDKAAVVITHAGLNTVMESLARGNPMLCLPVTNDQPGVASRVCWLGAGELMLPNRVTPVGLRNAVQRLLTNPGYREASGRCAAKMTAIDGLKLAVDVVEKALTTGKCVPRDVVQG